MANQIDRDEIKEMIANVTSKVVKDSLDEWMKEYGLKPHHWVYLEMEYEKTMNRRNIITRMVLTALVSVILAATLWGAEEWIKSKVTKLNRSETITKP